MYLPALMLERFGWPGLLIFAIPNILGCAAFGYILKNRERSLALVLKHRKAMKCFSLVTIAYHVFFIGFASLYLLPPDLASTWIPLVACPALILIGWALSVLPFRVMPVFALLVYAASLFAFARHGIDPLRDIIGEGSWPSNELVWLAPAFTFGFLLCPYLDPTFHRALQQSDNRHAFGVFGIAFAVMILFTCAYWTIAQTKLTWIIGAHLLTQSIFTVAVHMKEVRALSIDCCQWRTSVTMLAPLIVLPLAFAGVLFDNPFQGLDDIYIRFLGFYGLIFPAYVLLFMGPLRTMSLTRSNLVTYGMVVIIGSACYEAGYLHHLPWMVIIPLAVLLGLALRPGRS
ncbi:MAG: hypothetical protein IID30_09310 [Planctomycetes bacterium]|nr:hypothetical protein [Planctomycetota bacterium]